MFHTVRLEPMKEHEIQSETLQKRYVELSAWDARECFDDDARAAARCVACEARR